MQEIFNFTNPGNYNYDAALVEFDAGHVQLLNLRPADATFYCAMNSKDGDWGNGVLTGTVGGSVPFAGGEASIVTGVGNLQWPRANNADFAQVGTIRFRGKMKYSGNPGVNVFFFANLGNSGQANKIHFLHANTGRFHLEAKSSADTSIVNADFPGGSWNPTSGVEYDIELNLDFNSGTHRLFIDGVLFSTITGAAGTRSATPGTFWTAAQVANTFRGDFDVSDLLIFNAVQHTANYTPDWSNVYDTVYITTDPVVERTAAFNLECLTSVVETAIKPAGSAIWYQLVFDGNPYWFTGGAWQISDGTDAEANTVAELNAGANLVCSQIGIGQYTFRALLHSDDGSVSPALDTLVINYDAAPAPPEPPIPPLPPEPDPDEIDFLTQSSNSRQRGPRGRRRGRPWYQYYGPGRRGDG